MSAAKEQAAYNTPEAVAKREAYKSLPTQHRAAKSPGQSKWKENDKRLPALVHPRELGELCRTAGKCDERKACFYREKIGDGRVKCGWFGHEYHDQAGRAKRPLECLSDAAAGLIDELVKGDNQ